MRKEVQQLEALRERLEEHNNQRTAAEARKAGKRFRQRLHSKFEGGFSAYEAFQIYEGAEEVFLECYPTVDFSLELAKEYRNISKDISTLMEKYQKIIKGIKLEVSFTSEAYDKFMRALYAVADNETLLRFADYIEKSAAVEGQDNVVKL